MSGNIVYGLGRIDLRRFTGGEKSSQERYEHHNQNGGNHPDSLQFHGDAAVIQENHKEGMPQIQGDGCQNPGQQNRGNQTAQAPARASSMVSMRKRFRTTDRCIPRARMVPISFVRS